MKQPNIVLIVVDQWRGDSLSYLNHPMAETPHLDTLAEESTTFCSAYSAVPSCIAARAALMTGMMQKNHGRVGYSEHNSWDYPFTLAGLLSDGGYHTHCVGKLHTYPARNLLGFHSVDLHDGYTHFGRKSRENHECIDDYGRWLRNELGADRDLVESGLGCNGYAARPFCEDEKYHSTSWVTTNSVDFLRRRDPTKPFFLNVSYHRPHPPFDPPKVYWDMFQNKELPDIIMGDWEPEKIEKRFIDSPVPERKDLVDRARRAYFAQLAHIDNQINRITHALVEQEVWDNTIVIFTADHGDMLFDHNFIAKSLPYEGSARIPFIMHFPKSYETDARYSDQVAELQDILPTLCDAAGIDIPEAVDGKSLL
ncbi:MAG: arylsulfatase, partial [Planctomycetes bacterium]|nr:arylsulfatase [Planctomycetota bacterium]